MIEVSRSKIEPYTECSTKSASKSPSSLPIISPTTVIIHGWVVIEGTLCILYEAGTVIIVEKWTLMNISLEETDLNGWNHEYDC